MDNYTLHRGRLIDHIQLVVNNFAASKAFYIAVLAELKIPMVITDDDYIWADELVISSVKSSSLAGCLQDGTIWPFRPQTVNR